MINKAYFLLFPQRYLFPHQQMEMMKDDIERWLQHLVVVILQVVCRHKDRRLVHVIRGSHCFPKSQFYLYQM